MEQNKTLTNIIADKEGDIAIGIIGAMDEEVAQLKAAINDREDHVIAGYEFSTGSIKDKRVVLLKSGIGKVNAAVGTSILLQHFAPDCIINTGSAGGFDPSLSIGDVVISTDVRHHDVDLTIFGYEPGQVPGMPPAFIPDALMASIAGECIAKFDKTVVHGQIATGDAFMNDPERVARMRATFPNMQAVEMEAAAIAQTCHSFKTPFKIAP
ncbi:MAG: 5'-methylthioadenosine/S-adenosylhomocysteine nucleosidase, partial [Pontibacterium sp.]